MYKNIFFTSQISQNEIHLEAEEARHMVKVLRNQVGDEVLCTDGHGTKLFCRIRQISKAEVILDIEKSVLAAPRKRFLEIALAPTKQIQRMEWLVEKGTEMGVHAFHFFYSKHSERRKIRLDRLEKIALSAMKQSKQFYLPTFHEWPSFDVMLRSSKPFDGERYIAHLSEESEDVRKIRPSGKTWCLVGPEGDFSKEELALAKEAGFHQVHLGSTRLRTETAALALISWHFILE